MLSQTRLAQTLASCAEGCAWLGERALRDKAPGTGMGTGALSVAEKKAPGGLG
jgi:hypothetical protein